MSALGAVVALLLWGQLFAVDSGNDVTDIADDGCPKPPMIANGYVEHLVRYQCKNYYRLRTEGDGVYTLNNEKQWTNKVVGDKLPECEAGATLINEQWLLTTAKNLFLNHSENATAKDIAPTLTLYVGKKQLVEIEKVVLHPNYSEVDIGLIKLKQKVPVNERVTPICLPSKDYAEVGRVGYVSGWGRNANFKFTDHLKYVMLPVADQYDCIKHYEGSTVPEKKTPKSPVGVQPILNKHTFCAGMSKYQEDTCYGDAGSAFVVHDMEEDTWYAAGILSFDKSCGVAEYGVYVKVTSIQDWVQKTIAEN
ncbi:PREDICTED: haptoglobin isoform X3 [Colobus angolensis palliatus]|uniref:haptoglobin isoform X3 n=1 Tax=Colobus angolensis palliatus TaxID=336983 RepID=UPI0005F4C38A|nr:PREDICTED: haptoglobin isoform X3 [Colobus angolensis palliatus]